MENEAGGSRVLYTGVHSHGICRSIHILVSTTYVLGGPELLAGLLDDASGVDGDGVASGDGGAVALDQDLVGGRHTCGGQRA